MLLYRTPKPIGKGVTVQRAVTIFSYCNNSIPSVPVVRAGFAESFLSWLSMKNS